VRIVRKIAQSDLSKDENNHPPVSHNDNEVQVKCTMIELYRHRISLLDKTHYILSQMTGVFLSSMSQYIQCQEFEVASNPSSDVGRHSSMQLVVLSQGNMESKGLKLTEARTKAVMRVKVYKWTRLD
jgi:hypothetical protein